MGPPCVAAIVPVFNRPRAVLEALSSIGAQIRRPDAVIVVDDGSTDDTARQVEQWLSSHRERLHGRLVRQSNQGVSAARNRGVAAASQCQLLAFLDSDDLWPRDYLARMTEALVATPAAVAATSDLRQEDHRNGHHRLIGMSRLSGHATASLFHKGPSLPSATVVRADAFHRIGGFETRYHVFEDFYLCLRLSMEGTWVYVPGAPAVRRSFLGPDVGGQDQLSATFEEPRSYLGQMRMLYRFIHADGGRAAVPRQIRKWRIAYDWYRLGRWYVHAGQPARGVKCFRFALRHNPWLLRAYRRRALVGVRRFLNRLSGVARPR